MSALLELDRVSTVRASDFARLPRPRRIVMADPQAFDVAYAINPHMLAESGELERVDRALARQQWNALRSEFEQAGLAVHVLPALPEQPDLVFCANQVLPIPREASLTGRAVALASNMRWPQRRGEVGHVARGVSRLGYDVRRIDTLAPLEGMGDGLWHPGRALLWAGVGPRSSLAAWRSVASWTSAQLAPLELVDPDFYHLDTALALLDERTCLWLPDALSPNSRRRVERLIPRRIEADEREGRTLLAANAFCPDGLNVWIQRGCERTNTRLRAAGYRVREVDTGEYLKSGGSVFCMKLCLW